MRKTSVKLVKSSVRIGGVRITFSKIDRKVWIQDPRSEESSESEESVESSQGSEGSVESSRVREVSRVESNQD